MKINRTAQLIYQSIYCALGLVAVVASFGIFDDYTMFRWDFYVHFTNVSRIARTPINLSNGAVVT